MGTQTNDVKTQKARSASDTPRTQGRAPATHPGCIWVDHPVLRHHLTRLRQTDTQSPEFRLVLGELSRHLVYEATRDLHTKLAVINTPMEHGVSEPVIADDLIVVSIMRAGNGMLDAVMNTLPFARVGHIGIYRDKFIHSTVEYFFRIPKDSAGSRVLVLDPMLATGDTAVAALQRLKEYGVGPISYVCILAAPEGIARLQAAHPDVTIYTSAVDRQLNERGYILPGLGDAGDRLYGTV
jgi:uracil phosphoribosyltransferase